MRHAISGSVGAGAATLAYQWKRLGGWEGLSAKISGPLELPSEADEEAFITEHYWRYSHGRIHGTMEYQVEPPRWRVRRTATAALECEVRSMYGPEFVDALSGPPCTAFVAEGSPVVVRRGRHVR